MAETDGHKEALELALRKLRARDRFEAEIRSVLSEFPITTVDRVISHLKDRRIIDDDRSIINLIEHYSGRRSIGLERLRAELIRRGAPEETIDAVLGDVRRDERQKMLEALAAKYSPTVGDRGKAARFLHSRGFAEEEIEGALDCFFRT